MMAGVVLGERTQYSFSPGPPSSRCSSRIPAIVREGRGGEAGFAMNQQTQLQFGLRDVPNRFNLATGFDPRKMSPVVVEKVQAGMRPSTVSGSRLTSLRATSDERMALAMKLAKREAKRERRESKKTVDSDSDLDQKERLVLERTLGAECKYCDDYKKEKRDSIEDLEQHLKNCNLQSCTKEVYPKPSVPDSKVPLTGSVCHRMARSFPKPPQVAIVEEIERLKIDLENQLKKMDKAQKLPLEKAESSSLDQMEQVEPMSIYREPTHWHEEEETEERKQQRQAEQLVRNARMMYDLSQQVCRPCCGHWSLTVICSHSNR